MHRPDANRLDTLARAAIELGLSAAGRRALLLDGLPPTLVADLPTRERPGDQLRSDLNTLAGLPDLPEAPPLAIWLENAAQLAKAHPEHELLLTEARRLRGRRVPAGLLVQWRYHVGAPPLGERLIRPDGKRWVLGRKAGPVDFDLLPDPGRWPPPPDGFVELVGATHRISPAQVWLSATPDEAHVGRPAGAGRVEVEGDRLRAGEARDLAHAWTEISLAGALLLTVERLA